MITALPWKKVGILRTVGHAKLKERNRRSKNKTKQSEKK